MNTNIDDLRAAQVSLREQLLSVPKDARLVTDDGPYSTRHFPIGRMCHEAAAALAASKPEPQKPAECAGGCPEQQVCDNCQGTGGKDNLSLEQDVSNSVAYAQSTPSLQFGYSMPEPQAQALMDAVVRGTGVLLNGERIDPASIYKEPQAQAGEPPVVAIVDGDEAQRVMLWHPGIAAFDYPVGTDLITLQSHREAMLRQEAALHAQDGTIEDLRAALKACVEALQSKRTYQTPDGSWHDTWDRDLVDAAITQAQGAMK